MKKPCSFAALLALSLSLCGLTSCGEQTHEVFFYVRGSVVERICDVKHGAKISEPSSELIPKGYEINGWDVDVGSLMGRWSFDECQVYSDLKLYADYEYATYNVTLIGRDDSQAKTVQVTYNSEYDFSGYYDHLGSYIHPTPDHLEDEKGNEFEIKGVWNIAHDVVLRPSWPLRTISYAFMELVYPLSAQDEFTDGKGTVCLWPGYLEDVQNENPTNASGTAEEMASYSLSKEPYKEGYQFEGWFRLDNIGGGDEDYSTADASVATSAYDGYFNTVYGLFSKKSSFSLSSSDENRGKVEFLNEKVTQAYYDDKIAVRATPKEGYLFEGWYLNDQKVSEDADYVFSMPHYDCALHANFITEREALGMDPYVYPTGPCLTYGLYPQNHVSDKTIIASLNSLTSAENNGWYLLNGEYYAKKSASPYDSSYVFDDGTKIVEGATYWFKCEPIEWKILSSSDGEYSLVSTVLLDAHRYADSSNNYANSEIRKWLNGDFYDSAFSLGNSIIQTTTVDNSASTTDSSSNGYACANTDDKVYLLSYKDYLNADYGFSTSSSTYDVARQCRTTDWARANGAWYSTSSSYLYNGWYWTRSPNSSNSYSAWDVIGGGYLNYNDVYYSFDSVRPGLRIKIVQ